MFEPPQGDADLSVASNGALQLEGAERGGEAPRSHQSGASCDHGPATSALFRGFRTALNGERRKSDVKQSAKEHKMKLRKPSFRGVAQVRTAFQFCSGR
jgi:hypothetical protein